MIATACATGPASSGSAPNTPASQAPAVAASGPNPSPSPGISTLAPASGFVNRFGNNPAGATSALGLSRRLYPDGFWEVYVATTPVDLGLPGSTDPAATSQAAQRVTAVRVIMATESGSALARFRQGGHEHEITVIRGLLAQVQRDFPAATAVDFNVYFGERDFHAIASWAAGGDLQYTVKDSL